MRSDARPHQRFLLVPQPRQRLLRVQAAVFLPLLRRLGGLGGGRPRGGASALRAQAARLAADVGGARGARRDVPVEPFIADVVQRMRGDWRSSRDGRYRDNPKTLALFEHEYTLDLKPEVWQALSRNVTSC